MARSIEQPTAFDEFYAAHAVNLLTFFARRTLDAEAAADLTAETFAQAYRSRRRFRGRTDAEAGRWLYAIAHRQLARFRRDGRAERAALERLGLQAPVLRAGEAEAIEDLAGLVALRRELTAALGELSSDTRTAVYLRVVEELPFSAIARRLGVTEEAARARVSRALRGLAHRSNMESLA